MLGQEGPPRRQQSVWGGNSVTLGCTWALQIARAARQMALFLWEMTFLMLAQCGLKCTWKNEERMKKANGKPNQRTKIALRVIVWWPFSYFFFEKLIPALVKVTIGQRGTRKRYKHFLALVQQMPFFLWNYYILRWEPRRKKTAWKQLF